MCTTAMFEGFMVTLSEVACLICLFSAIQLRADDMLYYTIERERRTTSYMLDLHLKSIKERIKRKKYLELHSFQVLYCSCLLHHTVKGQNNRNQIVPI